MKNLTITKFKDGIVKEVRDLNTNKILKDICVGKEKFRRNNVYKTYNSISKNELLHTKDSNKIRKC